MLFHVLYKMLCNNRAIYFVVVVSMFLKSSSKVQFTNINCTSLDTDFLDFEYCFLKSVNRSYKYLSFKANLYRKPVTKVKVNLALFKKFSGYRPFMYNYTVDSCTFLKNPQANPVANYFYSFLRYHSNLNHTCPYNHDVILDKLSTNFVNNQFSKVLPFPEGDYLVITRWIVDDTDRALVKMYGTLF